MCGITKNEHKIIIESLKMNLYRHEELINRTCITSTRKMYAEDKKIIIKLLIKFKRELKLKEGI